MMAEDHVWVMAGWSLLRQCLCDVGTHLTAAEDNAGVMAWRLLKQCLGYAWVGLCQDSDKVMGGVICVCVCVF